MDQSEDEGRGLGTTIVGARRLTPAALPSLRLRALSCLVNYPVYPFQLAAVYILRGAMVVRAPASRRAPEQAEERLLVEAAQKDPTRFAELYEINFERVYAFVAWRVGDRDAAEDLTSEVFHKALSNLRRFEWRGAPFASWLLRIAANAIADRAGRAGKELAVEDPPELAADATADLDLEEGERR